MPAGGLFLTAGADVQKDRIEVSVWAWGRGLESWLVDHIVIEGGPGAAEAWAVLDGVLGSTWPHASGARLGLARLGIEEGQPMSMQALAGPPSAERAEGVPPSGANYVTGLIGELDTAVRDTSHRLGLTMTEVGALTRTFREVEQRLQYASGASISAMGIDNRRHLDPATIDLARAAHARIRRHNPALADAFDGAGATSDVTFVRQLAAIGSRLR